MVTFIWYFQYQNIGKPNNLKVFESKESNGTNQDSYPWGGP